MNDLYNALEERPWRKTRLYSVRDRVLWMHVPATEESSLTLLPDHWGPHAPCLRCQGAWSHVEALGFLAGTPNAPHLTAKWTLKSRIHGYGVVAHCEGLYANPALARVRCVDGHTAVVYSDGYLEAYYSLMALEEPEFEPWADAPWYGDGAVGMSVLAAGYVLGTAAVLL